MKKEIVNILNDVVAKSKFANTEKDFFNCVSHAMIMNAFIQFEERKKFYLQDDYAFNHFMSEETIILFNGYEFKKNNKFFKQFKSEIVKSAMILSNCIENEPLTDIFKELFEIYYEQNDQTKFAKYIDSKLTKDLKVEYVSFNYDKNDFCNVEPTGGTGFLLYSLLNKISRKAGLEEIQKLNITYLESDPFFAQIFIAQTLTNMFNHNLDFKVLDIYIASKARYYDCGGYKEAGHVMIVNQNEFVAKRVLEIQNN